MTKSLERARALRRAGECVAWLRKHRPPFTPWLALDDREYLFRPSSPNLMLLDGRTGFLEAHQDVLRSHFRSRMGE